MGNSTFEFGTPYVIKRMGPSNINWKNIVCFLIRKCTKHAHSSLSFNCLHSRLIIMWWHTFPCFFRTQKMGNTLSYKFEVGGRRNPWASLHFLTFLIYGFILLLTYRKLVFLKLIVNSTHLNLAYVAYWLTAILHHLHLCFRTRDIWFFINRSAYVPSAAFWR